MPTTRTPIGRAGKSQITPECVEQFRIARAIYDADQEDVWEERGGKRRAYLDACVALHTLLRRKPWQTDIVDTLGQDTPPSYEVNNEDWRAARQIRIEPERAAAN
jgi:hypothetical protein